MQRDTRIGTNEIRVEESLCTRQDCRPAVDNGQQILMVRRILEAVQDRCFIANAHDQPPFACCSTRKLRITWSRGSTRESDVNVSAGREDTRQSEQKRASPLLQVQSCPRFAAMRERQVFRPHRVPHQSTRRTRCPGDAASSARRSPGAGKLPTGPAVSQPPTRPNGLMRLSQGASPQPLFVKIHRFVVQATQRATS
jgi:hypothetical protein